MQPTVDIREYEDCHGSGPRGRGNWQFAPAGKTDIAYMSEWYAAPMGLTYSQAKHALFWACHTKEVAPAQCWVVLT